MHSQPEEKIAAPAVSLRHKLGQLVMAGFDGYIPTAHLVGLIRDWHLGGVILFRRNIDNIEQLAALNQQMQHEAQAAGAPMLLVGIDQEGGMVARIESGVTPLPSALAFSTAGSVDDCKKLTRIANQELLALGINVNFAPVLDVNNNPHNPVIGVRAFGETVEKVCDFGLAALSGIQASGVVATAKHFPGHGDTTVDSHLGLPRVEHARDRLDAIELVPFRAAIAAGVEAMMSAHVVFPAIEPEPNTPATLSHAVLTGLLREEMGFGGVIFTDCLEMAAIARGVGVVQGALQAFKAGADVLLVSHSPELQLGVLQALLASVERGDISETRIDESLARLAGLKARLDSVNDKIGLTQIAAPASLLEAARIQAAGLSFKGHFEPLNLAHEVLVVMVLPQARTEIDELLASGRTLGRFLDREGARVQELMLPLQPSDAERESLLAMMQGYRQCVLVTYNAVLHDAQQALLQSLPSDKLWLVAGRLPYDLDLISGARGRLTAFANTAGALQSLAVVLAGR